MFGLLYGTADFTHTVYLRVSCDFHCDCFRK